MIFSTEALNLPSKEVFLEDKGKAVSYPGDMHEDDIKFHIDINEYGKSPLQALQDTLVNAKPIISDEEWIQMGETAKERIKAVPELIAGAASYVAHDVKKLATGEIFKAEYTAEDAEAAKRVIDPAMKITHGLLETFVLRLYEPPRALIGGIVEGKPGEEIATDVIRAAVMPSSVPKITGPERVPLTGWELEGGVERLLPRALTMAVEDVLLYGNIVQQVPKMIQNYEINATKNLMRKATADIHKTVMQNTGLGEKEAWDLMNKPEHISYIYYKAQQALKGGQKLYSGLPVPKEPGEAVKAAGEGLIQAAKKPQVLAGAATEATKATKIPPPEKPTAVSPGPEEPPKPPYKERGFISSIKEELPQLKVAGQYISRSTDALASEARDLIKNNLDEAEKMAAVGTDDKSIAVVAELLKHYTDEAAKATDKLIKDALYEKAADLGNNAAVRLTELGRSVQAASILSRMSPEGQIRAAARSIKKYNEEIERSGGGLFGMTKKIPELNKDQVSEIARRFEEIAKLPDGEEKAMKWQALQNYMQDLVPTPMMQRIVTLWKAGLLTGIKTHGLNTFSNLFHSGMEIAKDVPATAIDSVASLFTGKRTVAVTLRGIPGGAKEGFDRGWKFLKTGYDQRNALDRYDYKRVSFGKSKFGKALQAYEETIFRLLGAEDQVFYYGAKARSIAEQALVKASNKKMRGKAKTDYVNNLIENPTDDMLAYAVADAETAVFQNKTALGEAGSKITRAVPVLQFIAPFVKTPSAVAMQIINYSPVGAVKTAFKNIGKGKFDQRDFSKGMGRAVVGTAIMWMGYELWKKGNIALDRPTSEREQKVWELENRKPNSIKVGDKYRSVQVLGPAGNLILMGGHFAKAFEESGSPTEAISVAMAGSAKSFTEQTFLTGVERVSSAIKDPKRYAESWATGLISSAIPTISADLAKATDKTERRVEDIPGALAARVPGLRGYLQPQIDILGQERIIKENFFEIMADPTRPLTEVNNPIVQEIGRLDESGYPISTTQLGDKEGYDVLTPEQNTELWQQAGSIALDKITSFMSSNAYDNMEDEERAKEINKIFNKAKLVARTEKVIEITAGLDGQEMMSKLSEAKKDGLLNKEVLDLYKKMR
jgi:hypothetical protein